jgi:2-dehydro-3-deoxygluconokinase
VRFDKGEVKGQIGSEFDMDDSVEALFPLSSRSSSMKRVVTFGEIMLRLAPPGFQRLTQARSFEAVYGGGEANVAVSLANFGEQVEFVTRLPRNDLGDACLMSLRGHGIHTKHIARGGERLGIYFLETGAAQRGSKVIYDRAGSSFATIQAGTIDWKSVFEGADWFHWTGITPAVSQEAAEVCREAIQAAREMGLTVSCDLNYRAKLWKWGKSAGEGMADLVGLCDLALGNEEDAEKVFGIRAPEVDVTSGKFEAGHYLYVCEELARKFPALKTIAITLRGSLSASHNTWSGVLWKEGAFYAAPTYDILPVVDRVGSGDAFMGGLIYGLRHYPQDPQKALNFAAAAACLKHSVPGDFNAVTVSEVEALMAGDASGRVSR